ncbi:ABC transporter substrate-binding protein [Breznakia pachnodae]|uniref:Multiple sugar transport system substrate-binding protein n=1 Tax=Breznakia pachnodae TaxID=265178 RepID=A0ABU0E0P5_9FIRM|nr:extracellular solute-binding protein [Breznakia pachnodae]MDQ0360401.1 multiple sugar transport system substrate-binding protein [Breznakia pachnodae]
MKSTRKMILVILIALMGIAFVVTANLNSDKTIRIGVFVGSNWDVPDAESYKIIDDVIARYKEENVSFDVEYISGIRKEDYSEWISQQALKGEAPDLFFVLSNDFPTFTQVGLLENLDSYIENDPDFDEDKYYQPSYQSGHINEHMYALPYESVPNLVFVNKTLLSQEGIELPENDWTWEEFYEICRQVTKDTDGDGKLDQFGVYGYTWEDAIFSNGVTLYNSDDPSTLNFNQSGTTSSIEFMRELNQLNDNINVTSQMFDEGKVAFCIMPFSEYRTYMPYPWRVKKYSNFEWDCVKMPAGEEGGNVSKVDTLLIGMSSDSRHKEEAWELLKMISYDQTTQKNIFEYSQGVSVIKDVTDSQETIDILFSDNPGEVGFEMTLLNDVMENGEFEHHFNKYDSIKSLIDNEVYRIINSESDIKTEMMSLQNKINATLKE